MEWSKRKGKWEEDEVEKFNMKHLQRRQLRAKGVTEEFKDGRRPFVRIIFLTSCAGHLERRGENVANVGTRWWVRRFHKGESKTQDVA